MSWRDAFRQGSFRGVAFRTVDTPVEGGRRGEWHEFPQADTPWFEDLGRKARRYTINCWVAGADHISQAAALVAAMEGVGAGTLVHPFLGEMRVAAGDYSYTHSAVSGGVTEFTLNFMETSGAPLVAASAPDTAAQSEAVVEDVTEKATPRFVERFSVGGFPAFVEDEAVKIVSKMTDIARALAAAQSGRGVALRLLSDVFMRVAPANIRNLVRAPLLLANSVTDLFRAIELINPAARDRIGFLRALAGFEGEAVIGATPPRIRQSANQNAFIALVRTSACAALVRALAQSDFDSHDAAVAARADASALLDALSQWLADRFDDDGYRAVQMLHANMVRDLGARGGSLARIYSHTPRSTEPALVTARRLYDETSDLIARADDIVGRNRLRHPVFVPGGAALSIIQGSSALERAA